MRERHSLHASTLALLRKFAKVSDSAVSAFLEGFSLVQSGLRLAYLVDTVAIQEESLNSVQILLNQDSVPDSLVFLLYECTTQQAFILNAHLCSSFVLSGENPVYIDALSGNPAILEKDTLSTVKSVLADLQEYAAASQQLEKAYQLDINKYTLALDRFDQEKKEAWPRNTMITLCGLLLEFPFVYCTPPVASHRGQSQSLKGVPLCILELLMKPKQEPAKQISIIKFSVPQAFKKANLPKFNEILDKCRAKYQARLAKSNYSRGEEFSLSWSMNEHMVLQNVAL